MCRIFILFGVVLALPIATMFGAPLITTTTSATVLVDNILGPGVTLVGVPSYTGVTNQSGTFTNGGADIGFNSGIVLTSGNATLLPGSNAGQTTESVGVGVVNDNFSTDLGRPGDAGLQALAGNVTFDAAVLDFQFEFDGGVGGDLYFNFVFGSEEYVDYIGSKYNDAFGFWVDGVNIAIVPGTSDPITINKINNTSDSAYYRNNVANTNGIPVFGYDIKLDGRTVVMQAKQLGLGAGTHTMKFAVGDTSDHILDAAVFIQAGTFSTEEVNPDVPEPATLLLLGGGLLAFGLLRRFRG